MKHLRTSVFRASHLMLSKGCICWGRWEFREFRGHFTGYRMISSQRGTTASADSNCGKIEPAFVARSIIYLHIHENSAFITTTCIHPLSNSSQYIRIRNCDLCNIVSVTINALKFVTCKNYFRHNIGLYNLCKCNLW